MFSSRLPAALQANALSRAVSRARREGRAFLDLTLSNPTRAGIPYPEGWLLALSAPGAAIYDPQPLGLPAAREAIAADYARRGVEIPPEHIAVTSSTSEAYSLLFKLLCNPCAESVLIPAPSYPLFEHLTALDGVRTGSYALDYHGRWYMDLQSVDRQWTQETRALLAVSPNNPTGSILTTGELDDIDGRCASREAALILDEVFADYPLDGEGRPIRNTGSGPARAALTFRLGGLSKSVALPQVKLGWIAVEGPAHLVSAAVQRLELLCDTYLSVSTPVQLAASALIASGARTRELVHSRVRENYHRLGSLAAGYPSVNVLHADGGWSGVMRIPARASEEEIVLQLLEGDAVLVHPGFFFDFPQEAYLVISLLPEPDVFREGVHRVLERVDA